MNRFDAFISSANPFIYRLGNFKRLYILSSDSIKLTIGTYTINCAIGVPTLINAHVGDKILSNLPVQVTIIQTNEVL